MVFFSNNVTNKDVVLHPLAVQFSPGTAVQFSPGTYSEGITKAICNKGFSGNSSILPRLNFSVGGQESSPQSLTAYSLNRFEHNYYGANCRSLRLR